MADVLNAFNNLAFFGWSQLSNPDVRDETVVANQRQGRGGTHTHCVERGAFCSVERKSSLGEVGLGTRLSFHSLRDGCYHLETPSRPRSHSGESSVERYAFFTEVARS